MIDEMQDLHEHDFLPRYFYTGICGLIDLGFYGVAYADSSDPLTLFVAEASGKMQFRRS